MVPDEAKRVLDEAKRVLDEARIRGIILRLFGGVAVLYRCPSVSSRVLQRSYPDLDFFGTSRQGRPIRKLFSDLGYEANQRFNALNGETRLIFEDPFNQRRADVFLDIFHMCHTLHIGKRLTLDDITISISDLLMTKLQIVELNEKDVSDVIAVLQDHDVANSAPRGDKEKIDSNYVAGLCASDWGLCTTVTMTLRNILGFMTKYDLTEPEKATVQQRINRLIEAIQNTPKSLRWKVRAVVGEKKRWYDVPEVPIRTQQV